jgi:hypothetical protein
MKNKEIARLYKRSRDLDGTIICGEEDYHMVEEFNAGLSAASKVYEKQLADTTERLDNLRTNSAKTLKYYVDKCVVLNKKLESANKSRSMADQWLRYNDKNPGDAPQSIDNSENFNEIPTDGNLI